MHPIITKCTSILKEMGEYTLEEKKERENVEKEVRPGKIFFK